MSSKTSLGRKTSVLARRLPRPPTPQGALNEVQAEGERQEQLEQQAEAEIEHGRLWKAADEGVARRAAHCDKGQS